MDQREDRGPDTSRPAWRVYLARKTPEDREGFERIHYYWRGTGALEEERTPETEESDRGRGLWGAILGAVGSLTR